MPITSDNKLPHMSLKIGENRFGPAVLVLYDTGTVLTSGYLPYHQHIRQKYPHIVHSFKNFDRDNPFDPIKFMGTVSNVASYNAEIHRIL